MPRLPASQPSPLSQSITRALFAGLLAASPLLISSTAQAQAPAAEQSRSYAIPAGNLDQALNRFASEAGILLSVDSRLTAGKRSPGLNGSYSVDAGLAQLLGGTGLRALKAGDNYALEAASTDSKALELGATTIIDTGLGSRTEDTGSYTTAAMQSATKLALTARETPQSVSVVTRQRMDDRGMQDLHDAIKDVPGLTVMNDGPERPNYLARGFQVDNIMYDGLTTSVSAYTARDTIAAADTAMLDRVEVVRGATGLMSGSGNPSAAVNLVRKRPTRDTRMSITGTAGSWDNYRTELDVSGALNDSGSVRARGVTAYQAGNSYQDVADNEQALFYGIAEIDLSDRTMLTVGASNQNINKTTAWGGIPNGTDGRDLHLPRSTFLGNDYGRWDRDNTTAFTDLTQQFDNGWKVRLAATKMWSDLDMLGAYASEYEGTYDQLVGGFRYENDQSSYDVYADGPFKLLGREHELVVGASHRREHFQGHGQTVYSAFGIDIYDWDPSSVPKPDINWGGWQQKTETEQTGTYVTARFNLADPLHLIVGARLDWYDYDVWTGSNIAGTTPTASQYSVTRNITKYAGLVYDIDETYSVYASYTDIFSPQGVMDVDNKPIEAIIGKNYELGIKGEYFDGALNASAALFQIDQENRAAVVTTADICQTPAGVSCYEASGEVRSQGIELEISGALTPSWQIAAGYTYTDTRYVKDANPANEGSTFDSDLPRHLFKAYTSYTLPGQLERWRIGGGVTVQNTIYNKGEGYRIEQEGYAVADLMLGYKVSQNLDLRLNVNNVFDKRYYQTINGNTYNAFGLYGEPRNAALTVKWSL